MSDCASGIYCKNGGLCIGNESDYSCDCSVIVGSVYFRLYSQPRQSEYNYLLLLFISDCSTGIYCQHGGTCTELYNGSYQCTCTDGWKGRNCTEVGMVI